MDMPFLFLVLLLVILGLIMMFSASYPSAYANTGDSYNYLMKQSRYAADRSKVTAISYPF